MDETMFVAFTAVSLAKAADVVSGDIRSAVNSR
jgi:hypothetical protein